jgi:hypothetical protein
MELPEIKAQFFELLKTKFTSTIFERLCELEYYDLIGNFNRYDDFINYQWHCLFHYDSDIVTRVYHYWLLNLPCYVDLSENVTIKTPIVNGFIFNYDGILVPYKI